ncbi:hypothetical protein BDY19DRAFT_931353 [Irpex rosettiformis]|uniref:Uncharacterized protein n=1 Tax=Irpex rosettiformis TaxID=378272 RepID=A0ACB8UC24_9APHY|nr:hypothetical protein BDY19DRAFT_931353 [Irpex rosettiformis]
MVSLSPNFAVLASFSALAATVLAPVNGVAIPSKPYRSQADRQSGEAAKFDKHRSGGSTSAQSTPSGGAAAAGNGLPLPFPIPLSGLGRRLEYNADGQPVFKRWDPLDPLLEIGNLYIGDNPDYAPTAQSEAFAATSVNERVHSTSERVHTEHHPAKEGVDMIVTGSNEHIHVTNRSPEPPRRHRGSRIIVSGDNNGVRLNAKRAPHHHRGSYRNHHYHWRRDTNGSSQPLEKRLSDHEKCELGGFDGVPGIIDIVSTVAGSDVGQRVASLVLSSALNGTNSLEPFVLNASGTNKTQVYLVVLDDEGDSSPSTFKPNGRTSSSIPANSTAPSGSTSPDNSAAPAAQSLDASASVSLGPSASASIFSDNSTTPMNSTSQLKKVAIQLSMFDPVEAALKLFCATFDPQPSAPSPLTVESCTDGVIEANHKSQVFSYNPLNGIIQPMWYAGEDGSADQQSADTTPDGTNSTSTSPPPVSESAANADGTDASADVGAAVARLSSLDRELVGDASGVRNFAARGTYDAQNVTLVFSPSVPILPLSDAPTEAQAFEPSASPSSSNVPTATFVSSSAISTDSASLTSLVAPSSASASGLTSSSDAMISATLSPAAIGPSIAADASSSSSAASTTATSASSGVLSSALVTGSASAMSSTSSSVSSIPTSSAHGLGVEVYDPSAEALSTGAASSASMDSSSFPTDSSLVSATLSSSGSVAASATATVSSSSVPPSMTPASTEPYEWRFRETSRKD